VLREESEEQAKSMLLPLLTSVQNLLVTWLPCKHPTTQQRTHMRLACEDRYAIFLHLRMQQSKQNRLASFDMPWKAYCKRGGNCYGRSRR
jgi:hypothetical protein